MTWEETINSIRTKEEFATLVRDAYFDADLVANVERFRKGPEWKATLELLRQSKRQFARIVDIGSGNGISTIAFALEGYQVIAVEPDPSKTIGAGAIRELINHYNLSDRVKVVEKFGEETGLEAATFDLVYIRQAMHHASDLQAMMNECFRLLKKGGVLLTVRDHVVFDAADKMKFLEVHPLHKFYGGENAFSEAEYKRAMQNAGFEIEKVLRYYDSIINYFPLTEGQVKAMPANFDASIRRSLGKRLGVLAKVPFVQLLYKKWLALRSLDAYDERRVAGRMYTFLAEKK